ncbi:MAG: ribonuclease III [Candidatus Levybacteria bacterium]|nr:ribonuclease III [Candidatus Levybacteria bacterium]
MELPKLKNTKLFEEAFTHKSYLNEVKQKIPSNERLEFLGDSILSFVVSSFLFEKYPNFNEGTLTNIRSLLVNTKSLSMLARELNIGKLLKLSRGEEESKGRENDAILENSFEAFVGAFFLDQGIEAVRDFLERVLLNKIKNLIKSKSFKDPKSILQEVVQAKKQNSPIYKVLEESGPAHSKTFRVGVYVNEIMVGAGIGKSKQIAESSAAKIALERGSF